MSDLAQRLAALSPEKRAILLKQLKKKQGQQTQTQIQIVPQKRESNELPLSFAQLRLWFLDQLEPQSSFYNMPAVLRLSGRLNVNALAHSLFVVVQRHEVLRTTFRQQDGNPVQVIASTVDVSFPVIDLSAIDVRQRDDLALSLAQQEARRPFDLTRGPLLRAALLRLGAQEHMLFLTLHHITSDGWSMGVLIRELAILFQAEAKGEVAVLPPLPIQYADYALWQRQWLRDAVLQEQLDYWRQHLQGAPTILDLPTDYPRPSVQTYLGDAQSLLLPHELVQELKALSQREETTLFMTLLAAFTILLMRYSGQQDIVVGTPIANRTRSELKGLIGFFVNMLALRVDLSTNPSFRGLLARIRDTTLQAFAHQDMPFEKVVEALSIERLAGYSPLFQVLFAVQNVPQASLEEELAESELSWRSVSVGHTTARFDLEFSLYDTSKGLNTVLIYNTALFAASTIEQFLQRWQGLLQAIVHDVGRPVFSLPVMTAVEQQLLLEAGRAVQTVLPEVDSLMTLFETYVAQAPDAIAILYEEQMLSYEELNRQANQLAHSLRARGIGPDVMVGICLERSPILLIALLAVLKAGGGYVPFDPAYPLERLAYMVQDASVPVVLTIDALRERLPDGPDLFCIDSQWERLQQESRENLHIPMDLDHLVYLIYTSGSTGLPKGTGVTRRGFGNMLDWFMRDCGFDAQNRVLVATSLSFDLTQKNLLAPLLSGGSVTLFPTGYYDPVLVCRTIAQHAVTFINCVPGMLYPLLEEDRLHGFSALSSLQRVFTGGEALAISHLLAWLQSANCQARIISAYGPTECSDIVSFMYLEQPEQYLLRVVPIGQPIPNTRLYLLDAWDELALPGSIGELYVGGEGVARGYLGRPELTAERFVPDPFSDIVGARLYRTGDLARYRSDGTLEFAGRKDQQVKIRGMRIELGEIETALQMHPQVRDGVVVVYKEGEKPESLVAYVTCEAGAEVTGQRLQGYLRQRLPDYMVPVQFMQLDELPKTPNGKVDRRALPAMDGSALSQDEQYVAPQTQVEESLEHIWSELLKQERVSVQSNFFAVGGHSLLATQVVSRLRATFQIELPLRSLFEYPTIAQLGQQIEALQHTGASSYRPTLTLQIRPDLLPLSFAQERLWFLHQFDPQSIAYNVPLALLLSGPLSVVALEQSLSQIMQRHEVLRTTFALHDNHPVQIINPAQVVPIPVFDLSGLTAPEREASMHALASEEAMRPFDLARGPLLRAALLRLDDREHVLLFTLHHIVSDGWSRGILVREVSTLYQSYYHGQSINLPALPLQYADYALWQRQWLQGEVLTAQLDYWRQQLAGAPGLLNMPTDRPRPISQATEGASISRMLPVALLRGLKVISQQEGVTLFMTLLAALGVLLQRYSRQDDLVVGSPIANRTQGEVEDLIGFFVNTLVLRVDLSGNPSFRQLLGRVREVTLQAYAHQEVPFEKLVEELQPQRSLSYSPFFQVLFTMQNVPVEHINMDEALSLQPLGLDRVTIAFDLAFTVNELDHGLAIAVEYSTALFDAATIVSLLDHWQMLLDAIAQNATQAIDALPLLTSEEEHDLLLLAHTTPVPYEDNYGIHTLFTAQARTSPDAIALVCEDAHVTYGQLEGMANQLAHYLRALGIRDEIRVGVCVERSPELVIGLLGILKAGGVYVPLDPEYPEERRAFMIEDAQVKVILTQEHLRATIPLASPAEIICLDSDWDDIHMYPTSEPELVVNPLSLAYVIYTSGSTGQPKGTMIAHQGLCNVIAASIRAFGIGAEARLLQHASMSFDNSVWEIFMALISGAVLYLGAQEMMFIGENLAHLLRQQAITIAILTPSVLAMVPYEIYPALQTLMVGGESCSADLAMRWSAGRHFFNTYGPTEATIHVTYYEARYESSALPPAIGRPNDNIEVYILDSYLRPLPHGMAGELYIGGVGVARGYWHRPAMTAERFLPHPFSMHPGARLYRTGDLVRYLPSGDIEFLGRVDQQVKIHGVRIELGEIEATLSAHPLVREAVVQVQDNATGSQYLIAFLVEQIDNPSLASELRRYLQQTLPIHMVPTTFVSVESIPLTPTGKVDRKALLAMSTGQSSLYEAYVAPRTAVEEVLVGIWMQVLTVARVGIYDDFFALGGHSLLATQVVSRLRTAFQIELPLRSLFEYPTIAQLGQQIEALQHTGASSYRPTLMLQTRPEVLPLSFAQERLWFLYQLDPLSIAYNVPLALRLSGPLSVVALEQSLSQIMQRHEVLRTTFALHDNHPVQIINPVQVVPIPVFDLSGLTAQEREASMHALASEEARCPFDLARGPLLRTALLRLGDREHVLLFTLHHIASDGWSRGILVREVSTLYQSHQNGQPINLPALPLQYADYALWQRQWLQAETLAALLDYWRQQLAGAPGLLNMPTDRPRPTAQTTEGAIISRMLPVALLRGLKVISQQEGVTLFMTLLAALGVLLQRYSGQDDLVVGSPIANRTQGEVEDLIGFFVNTLVLRVDLSGNPSFQQLLGRVREVTLQAYAHQEVPFEKLVEELQPQRSLSYSPLFQVLFSLQNTPDPALEIGTELVIQTVGGNQTTSKFDFSFLLAEEEQGLATTIEYNTDLFDAVTIVRLLDHWQVLLEAVTRDIQVEITTLPLLTVADKQLVAETWNATQQSFSEILQLQTLFEEQVERTPDALAVVFEEQALSYDEFNRQANRLAHWLRACGVGPDVPVGLYMERSLDVLIGLLGILKAGGVYVPFDPAYPTERLAFMIEDSGLNFLLTQQALLPRAQEFTAQFDVSLFCMDQLSRPWKGELSTNPATIGLVDHLAYIMYTSGSTGRPKGVALPHRALLNLMAWQEQDCPLTAGTNVLQFSSLSFDASCEELFSTWQRGGKIVELSNDAMRRDPEALVHLMVREQVERWFVPYVGLQNVALWVLHQSITQDIKLRAIMTAGEQLQVTPAITDWLQQIEGCTLYNYYGPTESHVVTAHALQGNPAYWPPLPPIGRPIANTQIYLLDAYNQLVPPGVPGELYIGGENLARGYLKRSDLTAERFVPHPFSKEPGTRLYRTGDLARYLKDGSIEYLGRTDQQVKLRGYRIEPGEIEAVLRDLSSVKDAVVVVHEDNSPNKFLIAYVIADTEKPIMVSELRSYLREKLPEYMVPAQVVMLEHLPLTSSGKVDRRTLAHRPLQDGGEREDIIAPRNPVEYKLASIWQELLNFEQVSVHDNFFEIGGHSLLAVQLLNAINRDFEVSLSLAMLFHNPTIAQTAPLLALQNHPTTASDASLIVPIRVRIRAEKAQSPFFVVHPVSGDLYSYLDLARHLPQDRPIYGIQAPGLFDGQDTVTGIEEMAQVYVEALLEAQPQEETYILGGHSVGGLIALEMARRLQEQGRVVSLLVLMDSMFSLEKRSGSYDLDETQWLMEVARTFSHYRGQSESSLAVTYAELQIMSSEEQHQHLLALAKAAQLVPQETDIPAFQRLLRVVRGNAASQRSYHPREIYQGDVVFLTCEDKAYDPWSLWRPFVAGSLEIQIVPGNHFSMLTEPHVRVLAAQLQKYLGQQR